MSSVGLVGGAMVRALPLDVPAQYDSDATSGPDGTFALELPDLFS